MIWLSAYLQRVFCRHDLTIEEVLMTESFVGSSIKQQGARVSMLCKKCGYHRSKWKFI